MKIIVEEGKDIHDTRLDGLYKDCPYDVKEHLLFCVRNIHQDDIEYRRFPPGIDLKTGGYCTPTLAGIKVLVNEKPDR